MKIATPGVVKAPGWGDDAQQYRRFLAKVAFSDGVPERRVKALALLERSDEAKAVQPKVVKRHDAAYRRHVEKVARFDPRPDVRARAYEVLDQLT